MQAMALENQPEKLLKSKPINGRLCFIIWGLISGKKWVVCCLANVLKGVVF
jgi:hypothetical protein